VSPDLLRGNRRLWLPALAIIFGSGFPQAFADEAGSGLRLCVANYHQGYFDQEFEDGPVTVPAGAVFKFNGYILAGDLQDPEDEAHKDKGSANVTWSGVTSDEQRRRTDLMDRYARQKTSGDKVWSALATTTPVTVTKSQPCATVPVKIVVPRNNHGTTATLPADRTRYYSLIGSIKGGAFDRRAWNENDRRGHAEYYASVQGAVTETLVLNSDIPDQASDQALEPEGYLDE